MLKNKSLCLGLLALLLIGCSQQANSNNNAISSSKVSNSVVSNSSTANNVISSAPTSTTPVISSSDTTSKIKPTRPHTHQFGEWEIVVEATLFSVGEKYHKCLGCDLSETITYYDLSEVTFKDRFYQYDGQEKELKIGGLLPKGLTVRYINNKLKDIGTTIATAYFLDEESNVVDEMSAVLSITPYIGLPQIKVSTLNGALIDSKENYTTASISVENCSTEHIITEAPAGIRLRGNGTLGADKKPYRIKFETKQAMLGLNEGAKAKSWVLLAEFYDYSMMRNATAFALGDALMNGRGYYSSDFTHVNVYINGVYNGVYLLCEQQQVNKNRIDIYEPELNESRLDIGYLVEMDDYANNQEKFMVGNSSYVAYDIYGNKGNIPERKYSLKSDFYTPEQKMFISKYMNGVHDIMYNAIFQKKYYTFNENYDLVSSEYASVYETLNAVMDIDSLIRSYILEEFMKDVDVGFSSYYMFVDFSENSKFKKLTFGAPWDFDWSSGNVTGAHLYNTNVEYNTKFAGHMNPWLFMITKADFFYKMVHDYWTLMDECNVIDNIIDEINYVADTFVSEFGNNFKKWQILGVGQHTYHSKDVWEVKSHRDAVDCLLRYMRGQRAFLDSKWL